MDYPLPWYIFIEAAIISLLEDLIKVLNEFNILSCHPTSFLLGI